MPSTLLARLVGKERVADPATAHASGPLDLVPPSRGERVSALYLRLGPAAYRRCLRLLRDPDAAKEAAQKVFVGAFEELEQMDDPASALRWTYRLATSRCLNVLRDQHHRPRAAAPARLEPPRHADSEYPTAVLAHQVLSRFDERTQAVVVGVFVDGMSDDEVAEWLGISRFAVRRLLSAFLRDTRER